MTGTGASIIAAPGIPPAAACGDALQIVSGTANNYIQTVGYTPTVTSGTTTDMSLTLRVSSSSLGVSSYETLYSQSLYSNGTDFPCRIVFYSATTGELTIRGQGSTNSSNSADICSGTGGCDGAWHTVALHCASGTNASYITLDSGPQLAFTANVYPWYYQTFGLIAGNTQSVTYQIGNIKVDSPTTGSATPPFMYSDFEAGNDGDQVTQTILNNGTHAGNGTWTSQSSSPAMTVSTSCQRNLLYPATVAGTTYTDAGSTRGIKFDLSQSTSYFYDYTWQSNSNQNSASAGFWFYTDLPTSNTSLYADLGLIGNAAGSDFAGLMLHSGQMYLETNLNPNGDPDVGSKFNYTPQTWYWVTIQFEMYVNSSTMHSLNIYDSNGNLLSAQKKYAQSNHPSRPTYYRLGRSGDTYTPTNTVCWDNLLLDYAVGAFPVLPGTNTTSVPTAPTGLTATPGNAQITLAWNASTGATSYNLYRGTTSGGESSTPLITGITSTAYTDTGLVNGQTYYYYVTAVNSIGQSGLSNEASATPQPPPPAPTGLTATGGNGQISLSWSASSGATSYNLYRGTTSGGESSTPLATGITSTAYTNTSLANGQTYYYYVTAVSSSGQSGPSNEASATTQGVAQTCPCTIFGSNVPTVADQGADNPVELGVRFTADVNGSITGIRFYKSTNNTGTHIGNLWTNSGTLLASATFTNETASGWQQVSFSSPVAITAGTVYVASYHCTVGHYAEDDYYFANSGYDNSPLHALQDGLSGADGAYAYGSTSVYPTNDWQSANYWVDVVFTPAVSGVSSVTLNPTSVTGGNSSLGTVTLSSPAPSAGVAITLSSDNPAATLSTSSLTIPSGSSSATFTVNTAVVNTTTTAHISATDPNNTTIQASLTITPVPSLSSVSVSPTSVVGGNTATGTVTLTYPAPSGTGGGAQVALASDNPAAAVPASVTVPAGATSATFTITTSAVSNATTADISGTYNGVPPPAAALTINPPALSSISVSPASVVGGNPSTGTVTLTGLAPTNGITVSLTSSNTNVASVPPNVTVAANTSSISFQVTTYAVTTSTPVTITASYGAASPTATLTVTPKVVLAIDKTVSTDSSKNGNSITSPTFSTAATNELLLAFIATDAKTSGSNITVTGVTGAGLTWSLVQRTNVQLGTAEIWRAFAPSKLTNVSVKASLSQTVAASITVVTFTGVNTSGTGGSGAIGATGTGNANPGAPTALLTTTHNGSWVFGVGNDWDNAISRTLGPNQTMIHQYLATVGDTYWVQSMTSPTPISGTMVTINDPAPTTDRYNLSIVEVLPSQ